MLRRLLRRDVAWQRRRLFSTATAARELPLNNTINNNNNDDVDRRKQGKRITKEERKALVVDFVEKYRAMNDGKFPTKRVTVKEVGGSYYTIRAILQELEYNSKANSGLQEKVGNCAGIAARPAIPKGRNLVEKDVASGRASELDVLAREMNANTEYLVRGSQLPSVDIRDSSSMVRQTAEANEVQEGVESPNQVALGRTPIMDYVEVTVETGSTTEREVDTSSRRRNSDMSVQTKMNDIPTETVSEIETGIHSGHQGTSNVDICDKNFLTNREVWEHSNSEKTPADDNIEIGSTSEAEVDTNCHNGKLQTSMQANVNEITTEEVFINGMGAHLEHERTSVADVYNYDKSILISREALKNSSIENFPADVTIKATIETGSTSESKVDTNILHVKSDMSIQAKTNETTTEEVFVNDTEICLVHERTSASDIDNCDKNIVRSKEREESTLEKVPTDETVKATVMEDAKFLATPVDPSQSVEGIKTELQGLSGKSAAQALNTKNISRETTTEKTQDELQESSLWGNLKSFASSIINIWRRN